jgi:hypothetical protein
VAFESSAGLWVVTHVSGMAEALDPEGRQVYTVAQACRRLRPSIGRLALIARRGGHGVELNPAVSADDRGGFTIHDQAESAASVLCWEVKWTAKT